MVARFSFVFIFLTGYALIGSSQSTRLPEDSATFCSECKAVFIDQRLLQAQKINLVKCSFQGNPIETRCVYMLENGDSIVGFIKNGLKEGAWFLFEIKDPRKSWKKRILYSLDTEISFKKNNRRRKKVEYRTHFDHQ